MAAEPDKALAAIVKDRMQSALIDAEMSPTALAIRIGRDRNYIRDFFTGKKKNLTADAISKAAAVLGVSLDYLNGRDQTRAGPANNLRTIPLYGHPFSFEDGRFRFQHTADVLCPPQLVRVTGPYAVTVPGDTMEPRFFPSNVVIVDPSRYPQKGNDVVVQLAIDGENWCYIKEFVSSSEDKITLRQLNPDRKITLTLEKVLSVHVIKFAEF